VVFVIRARTAVHNTIFEYLKFEIWNLLLWSCCYPRAGDSFTSTIAWCFAAVLAVLIFQLLMLVHVHFALSYFVFFDPPVRMWQNNKGFISFAFLGKEFVFKLEEHTFACSQDYNGFFSGIITYVCKGDGSYWYTIECMAATMMYSSPRTVSFSGFFVVICY